MNDVTTTVRPSPAPTPPPADNEPTLITEQQVLFATTAAAGARPARPGWWAATFRHAVHALVASPSGPAHRHNPRRYAYLELALLSREMDRL